MLLGSLLLGLPATEYTHYRRRAHTPAGISLGEEPGHGVVEAEREARGAGCSVWV